MRPRLRRRGRDRSEPVGPATGPPVLSAAEEARVAAAHAGLLRAAAALADAADPLDTELAVSHSLGSAMTGVAPGELARAQAELVGYLGTRHGRDALALLRAAATMGSAEDRALAGAAADALAAAGVAEPLWADAVGAVPTGECWVYGDVFGDQESVVCAFSHPRAGAGQTAADEHALVVLVDHNLGGIVKDIFCTARARRTIEAIRLAHAEDGPMSVLEPITPAAARAKLERAFAATARAAVYATAHTPRHATGHTTTHTTTDTTTDTTADTTAGSTVDVGMPPLGDSARRLWALALSRATTLPHPVDEPARPGHDGTARSAIVAEFLDSPPARTLSDRRVAARCARLVVDYGCDQDGQRPLRVSPAKTELFLLYWLPRRAGLSGAQVTAMPAVMEAWVRWAGARQGLSGPPLREVVAAAAECGQRFPAAYGGPGGGSATDR